MANTDQNITELPIKTASEVLDADYMLGIDLVEGYQVSTKDFADYAVNRAAISIGGKTQTTASAISEVRTTAGNAQPKESGKGLSANDFTNAYKSKLDGIAAGAEVNVQSDWSASSGDAAILHKPTTISGYGITDAYTKTQVDTSLAAKSDKATTYTKSDVDAIVNTDDNTSEAANPLVIETDAAQYAKKTHLTLEPVQDLHGYDHPWAGGAGKNLLPMTVEGIKAANSSATWSGNSTTMYGVTYTILTDEDNNVTGIKASGTPTDDARLKISSFTYKAGVSYSINGCPSDGGAYKWAIESDNLNIRDVGNGVTITQQSDYTDSIYLFVKTQSGAVDFIFYPMLRLSTETDATFAPYSNICPITGVDEVEVRATGRNLVPFDESYEAVGDSTWIKLNYFLKAGTYVFTYNPSVTTGAITFNCYDKDGRRIFNNPGIDNRNHQLTFTIEKDCYRISSYSNSSLTISELMIRLASDTDDTYEPYQGYTVSLDLPEPIYGGTLDLETGELVVDRAFWSKNTSTMDNDENYPGWKNSGIRNLIGGGLNNRVRNQLLNIGQVFSVNTTASYDILYFTSADYNKTQSEWIALAQDVQIVVSLATPIIYQLTPQQLALLKSTNVISTNAKTVQVTYRNGELATTGDIVASTEVAKQNAIGESASYTDARLATELAPILGDLATAETSPASASHAVGEYLLYNNRLYKVLAAISAGQQLTIGTNVGQTNVAAELTSLEQRLQALEAS